MRVSSRDSRGSDGLFLAALVICSLLLLTAYYREGVDGPIRAVRSGVQTVLAPVGQAGYVLTSPMRGVIAWARDLGVSRADLEALRQQNEEMRRRLAGLEEARLENERLRELAGFVAERELDAVGAEVIGRPASLWEGVITIDRGTEEGVSVGMPVLAAEGLIGQVVSAGPYSSSVRLITDRRSGVAALLQATRAEGIVRGSLEGDLWLDYVSRETTVSPGDAVVTSGMGGVYPSGLLIGEVADVQLDSADLFPRIRVRPSAQLAGLEEVAVLTGARTGLVDTGGAE
ncbi:MAG TPA: rod shape-determining protein MreC [Coriobacteriia bacterium]|nr:rod shape-determining protein MreC [Coriobacteriia bacterium]